MGRRPTGMRANELDKAVFLIYVRFFSRFAFLDKNPALETSPQKFQEF